MFIFRISWCCNKITVQLKIIRIELPIEIYRMMLCYLSIVHMTSITKMKNEMKRMEKMAPWNKKGIQTYEQCSGSNKYWIRHFPSPKCRINIDLYDYAQSKYCLFCCCNDEWIKTQEGGKKPNATMTKRNPIDFCHLAFQQLFNMSVLSHMIWHEWIPCLALTPHTFSAVWYS